MASCTCSACFTTIITGTSTKSYYSFRMQKCLLKRAVSFNFRAKLTLSFSLSQFLNQLIYNIKTGQMTAQADMILKVIKKNSETLWVVHIPWLKNKNKYSNPTREVTSARISYMLAVLFLLYLSIENQRQRSWICTHFNFKIYFFWKIIINYKAKYGKSEQQNDEPYYDDHHIDIA